MVWRGARISSASGGRVEPRKRRESISLANWPRQKDAFLPYLEEWVDNVLRAGNLRGGFDWYIGVDRFRARIIHGGGSRY
jgi:hypothetical protein